MKNKKTKFDTDLKNSIIILLSLYYIYIKSIDYFLYIVEWRLCDIFQNRGVSCFRVY